jgi:hypothetical protein
VEALNACYANLLHIGFIVLSQALGAKDLEWAEAERELLHNIPSLLNESNPERHKYFWLVERERYIEWASNAGSEQRSRMLTYYAPIWREMEPLVQELLSAPACHQ